MALAEENEIEFVKEKSVDALMSVMAVDGRRPADKDADEVKGLAMGTLINLSMNRTSGLGNCIVDFPALNGLGLAGLSGVLF